MAHERWTFRPTFWPKLADSALLRPTDWPDRLTGWPILVGSLPPARHSQPRPARTGRVRVASRDDVSTAERDYAPRSLRAMSRRSSRAILCFSVLSGIPR